MTAFGTRHHRSGLPGGDYLSEPAGGRDQLIIALIGSFPPAIRKVAALEKEVVRDGHKAHEQLFFI
jgi:hypothetical protein